MIAKFIKILLFIIYGTQIIITAQTKDIVAYYPEWGAAHKTYFVKNIVTSGSVNKITVLIYAFVEPGPDSSGNIVPKFMNSYIDYRQPYSPEMSVDGVADDSAQPLKGQFNQLKKLKRINPKLKILLSIGGWSGSTYYSDAALTTASREKFVDDCIDKFIRGNLPVDSASGGKGVAAGIFDGFDIDWEFPLKGGAEGIHNNPNDKKNLTKLFALFRKKMDEINPGLILTAAVAAGKPNVDNYDIVKDQKYLDWFNLMTYDFHGSWDNVAAHHTNLLASPEDTTGNGIKLSFDNSIKYFLDSLGVSGRKIVPGAAFYGKLWCNVDSINHGLYQAGIGAGEDSVFSSGNYSNISTLESKGYKYYWDTLAMAPWLYNASEKKFCSFDDPKSISLKAHYVDAYNLRGLMFWEISQDDSSGTLVNTIYTRNMPDVKIKRSNTIKNFASVQITEPKNFETFMKGSNVIINTNEIDKANGTVKVEFFGDGISLGYDTKAPFDWVWFNLPTGKHKIKAVASNKEGNKKFSKEVTINIY